MTIVKSKLIPIMSDPLLSPEIDQNIDAALSSMEETERLVEGSDEHLDILLDIRKGYITLSQKVLSLRDKIESQFAAISSAEAEKIIVKVFPLFSLAHKLVEVTSHITAVYEPIKPIVDQFQEDVDDLNEIVNDLSRYKVRNDTDFSSFIF